MANKSITSHIGRMYTRAKELDSGGCYRVSAKEGWFIALLYLIFTRITTAFDCGQFHEDGMRTVPNNLEKNILG